MWKSLAQAVERTCWAGQAHHPLSSDDMKPRLCGGLGLGVMGNVFCRFLCGLLRNRNAGRVRRICCSRVQMGRKLLRRRTKVLRNQNGRGNDSTPKLLQPFFQDQLHPITL
jgi:hypothetical protein